jgi:thioredoxin-related protein
MLRHCFHILFSLCLLCCAQIAYATHDPNDPLAFDDYPLKEPLDVPDWFKLSFLDLNDSLNEAIASGKKGLIVYFHRQDCAYCKAQLELNWGAPDIVRYTREHFDVIAIDVNGQRNVVDLDGKSWSEKEYAAMRRMDFTPSMLFYDSKSRLALRLPGFRPPYQFRAALEYVADGHYQKESFASYMERAEGALSFGQDTLNENDAFMPPPWNFDRSRIPGKKPLVIFFEHPKCHACDVLHAGPLSHPDITSRLKDLDAAQLDIQSDAPVITPQGKRSTARQWARELELSFSPTLIFFDESGKEIIRIDSVVRLYRLNQILDYVLSKDYQRYPTLQRWRERARK